MRHVGLMFVLVILFFGFCFNASALSPEEIISDAAILMDAQTGQVLFNKNGGQKMYPASTTKIMTGLLAAEGSDMKEVVVVAQSAIDIDEWDSANIGLVAGEKMTVNELMYAMMLPSANDAANVLAEHVAGNQADFARKMTEKAKSLGAVNTSFANAHGLSDQNHYTTAKDLALITRAAIGNPIFMQYFSAAAYVCPPTNKQPSERRFSNHQYMLVPSSDMYDARVIGGKVGYTHESRHTMSTVAVQNGRTLICVVMYSPNRNDKFTDTKALLDFGFGEFVKLTIPKEKFHGFSETIMDGEEQVGAVVFLAENDFSVFVHKDIRPDDIEIEYSHEYPFEQDESITAYAIFKMKSPPSDVPVELGRIRLEPSVTRFERPYSLLTYIKNEFIPKWWFWPGAAFITLLLLAAVLFSFWQIKLYRQLKRRRARIERIRQAREAREEREEMYSGNWRR